MTPPSVVIAAKAEVVEAIFVILFPARAKAALLLLPPDFASPQVTIEPSDLSAAKAFSLEKISTTPSDS